MDYSDRRPQWPRRRAVAAEYGRLLLKQQTLCLNKFVLASLQIARFLSKRVPIRAKSAASRVYFVNELQANHSVSCRLNNRIAWRQSRYTFPIFLQDVIADRGTTSSAPDASGLVAALARCRTPPRFSGWEHVTWVLLRPRPRPRQPGSARRLRR